MLKSMTGFGKSTINAENKQISIEIRSLNSKQLDLNIRVPSIFREKEIEIKNLISVELIRGKVDVNIQYENTGNTNQTKINEIAFLNYFNQIKSIGQSINIDISEQSFHNILNFPEVIKAENISINEQEWKLVLKAFNEAIKSINNFRYQEGNAIEDDFIKRINTILELNLEIEPFEKQRITKIKDKIKYNLEEIILPKSIDTNRFEQELIYYIEKIDITEEKIRLINHCNYFLETLNTQGEQGKKLGFIAQEIGREINTMGSKANDTDIQHIVIKMKDELEKIKEQALNIL